MDIRPASFVLGLAVTAVVVAAELPPGAEPEKPRGFHLDLLPKAFSKKPTLEMTVFTELTDYGRTLPEVTAQQPVYYVGYDQGYHPMGDVSGEHPPPPEEVIRVVRATLSERGFLVAGDQLPAPGLALFFLWGSHYAMDLEQAQLFPDLNVRQVLERAVLVGGRAYREQLDREFAFGSLNHTAKQEYLRYQAAEDLYYVVISAYDVAALAKNERRLAWRTTMTLNARGLSLRESLPPLITSAGYYFGRETGEPVAIRRDLRRGTVTLGPLRIIEGNVAVPEASKDK